MTILSDRAKLPASPPLRDLPRNPNQGFLKIGECSEVAERHRWRGSFGSCCLNTRRWGLRTNKTRLTRPPRVRSRHPRKAGPRRRSSGDKSSTAGSEARTATGQPAAHHHAASSSDGGSHDGGADSAQPSAPATSAPASSLRSELESSLAAELEASPFAAQPGTYGTLSAFPSGGVPQMIGDLGPIPRLSMAHTAASGSGLPTPFPPPRPPGVPGSRGRLLGNSIDPGHQDQRRSVSSPARPRVFHLQLLSRRE